MNLPMLRRRVERYAQLLDEAQTGTRPAHHRHAKQPADDEVAAMVALATRLSGTTGEVTLPVDRREAMRARLMEAAEAAAAAKPAMSEVETDPSAAAAAMPAAAMPVEAMPVEAMPVEAMPVEAMPVDVERAQAVPAGAVLTEAVTGATATGQAIVETPDGAPDAANATGRTPADARTGDGGSAVVGRAPVGTVHGSLAARGRRLPRQRAVRRTGRRRPRRHRIKVVILGGLAISTLAVSGISAASGGAMPGDVLYGMKRVAENAQIDLAGSAVKKASLYLQDAQRRLGEAQQVSSGSDLVISTLATMDAQTTTGAKLLFAYAMAHHDANSLATLDAFVRTQNNTVTSWAGRSGLPAKLAAKLTASGVLLDRIRQRSTEVRRAVACTMAPKTLASDDLGAEPTCPS